MHEFALAEAVITTSLDAAEKESLARITRIEVHVGELQSIRKETFEFALTEIMPKTEPRLAAAEITVTIIPARFTCRACSHDFDLKETGGPKDAEQKEAIHFVPELAHAFLRCPECESPDFEVIQGRGVSIDAIEGEVEADA
ncbi:MAG: hydrogenase nickel incorporation protein HypA [Planctomycetota bacterium]